MLIGAQDLDPDWFLDDVVVPGDLERMLVGPARHQQAQWQLTINRLVNKVDPALRNAVHLAARQGLVLTHAQARAAGLTSADLRRLVRRGVWTAPWQGVLCVLPAERDSGDSDSALPAHEVHGLRDEVRAAAAALLRPGTTVSHESAAAIHGLPLLGAHARTVLTSPSAAATCGRRELRVHVGTLAAADKSGWYGVAVTSVARTVVDLARCSGAAAGLIAADAALREQLTSTDELAATVGRATRRAGVGTARRVLALTSPLCESPLESLSRLLLSEHGIPLPEPQAWVETRHGRYRVDGLWADRRVVLEADGMLKYTRGALAAEKRRQEELERAGYRVVRVTWDDVRHFPDETAARVVRALRLGGRTPRF